MLKFCNFYKNYGKTLFINILNRPLRANHRYFSQALDVDTNVAKDIILYKHDKTRYFKLMNIAGVVQFSFWTYLSFTAFSTLRDIPVEPNKGTRFWEKVNLGESKYRYGISLGSGLLGWGILALTWMYSLRSVKYLILRKGGQMVTIGTYTPSGGNRLLNLNLKYVSAVDSRSTATNYIPLKVKGHSFHYLVDMKGEFRNAKLFDHTVGINRKL